MDQCTDRSSPDTVRIDAAITEAAKQHSGMLRQIAKRILGNDEDAEECVNDALLRVWQHQSAHPEDPAKDLRSYLAGTVRNLAIERLRSDRRKPEPLPLTELELLLPGGDAPEDALFQKQLTEALNDFLASLPADWRILFVRHYWYLDSIETLASALQLPKGTVKTRLWRSRERLRSFLRERGYSIKHGIK